MYKYEKPKCPECGHEELIEYQEYIYTVYRKIGKKGNPIGKWYKNKSETEGENAFGIRCVNCNALLDGSYDANDKLIGVDYK